MSNNAARIHEMVQRTIGSQDRIINNGSREVEIQGLNGQIHQVSCRIGEAIEVLKKAKGYYSANNDPAKAFRQAVIDTAKQFGITEWTVMDKLSQMEIDPNLAEQLYTQALKSVDPMNDELLKRLCDSKTHKDDYATIRKVYRSI